MIPNAEWEETECRLEPHERLVLVTDGVLEARNDQGVMLADDGFDRMLSVVAHLDTKETARRIAWAVRTREGDQPSDDLTVVVMCRVPPTED